jgi:hypothetical protein
MDKDCVDSRIYVREDDQWHQLPLNIGNGTRFPLKSEFPAPLNQIPISIKIADYNLDGYPDMVAVMKQGYRKYLLEYAHFFSLSNPLARRLLLHPLFYKIARAMVHVPTIEHSYRRLKKPISWPQRMPVWPYSSTSWKTYIPFF